MNEPAWVQRHIDHWKRTGKCLRHFSIDYPPSFCEQCGKDWKAVLDGRDGRKRRRSHSKKVGPEELRAYIAQRESGVGE